MPAERPQGAVAPEETPARHALVVDPDDTAADAIEQALGGVVRVLRCATAADALALPDDVHIELAVVDTSVPDMAAAHLAERLAARRRGVRVLFTSVRSNSPVLGPRRGFLAKPYTDQDVAWAINRLSRSR